MSTGKCDNYLAIWKLLFKTKFVFPTIELEESGI